MGLSRALFSEGDHESATAKVGRIGIDDANRRQDTNRFRSAGEYRCAVWQVDLGRRVLTSDLNSLYV